MMLLCKYLERERIIHAVLTRLLAGSSAPTRGRVRSRACGAAAVAALNDYDGGGSGPAAQYGSGEARAQMGSAAYVFRVALLTYALSALFTNDATCLLLTPLVLQHWRRSRRCVCPLVTSRFARSSLLSLSICCVLNLSLSCQ